jgi:hypothetical protein
LNSDAPLSRSKRIDKSNVTPAVRDLRIAAESLAPVLAAAPKFAMLRRFPEDAER